MGKRNAKNPLRKRILRELAGDWRKYLVVSLFLILTIGFVSGMYVANGSMEAAANAGIFTYKLEDGHFELDQRASPALLSAIETGDEIQDEIDEKYADAAERYGLDGPEFQAVPVRVYENFFRNEDELSGDGTAGGTVRVYTKTEDVNLACLMDGRFPQEADEIAIDRMHADNVGVKTGDTIRVGGQPYTVVGLLAYVNYSTLHEKNTDFIFDALRFDVAMVTEEGFDRLDSTVHYAYAWRYECDPADEQEEKRLSDDFLKALLTQAVVGGAELEDYLPRYANSAVNFSKEDMGSDKAMGGVLLDILIVIIAFIFAVTISNTITREAQAIGNLLGYTAFKYVVVSMYYNSYSLPAYETVWNPEAFLKTTLIPVALMLVVNLAVIVKMLRHTPLQFLRRDLKRSRRKKAVRLPQWSFFSRFRLRVMFQNIPNYLILFFGIFFISVMLAMAVGLPSPSACTPSSARAAPWTRRSRCTASPTTAGTSRSTAWRPLGRGRSILPPHSGTSTP